MLLGLGIGGTYAFLQILVSSVVDFQAEYGFPVWLAVLIDLGGGSLGGLIAGLGLQRKPGLVGSMAVSVAAVTPTVLALAVAEGGWTSESVAGGVIAGGVIGTLAGLWVWFRYAGPATENEA